MTERARRAERMIAPLRTATLKLQTLGPADVAELRDVRAPPGPVLRVLIAVCVLFGKEATEVRDRRLPMAPPQILWWPTARELLSEKASGMCCFHMPAQ